MVCAIVVPLLNCMRHPVLAYILIWVCLPRMHGCHTYKEIPSTFKIWQVSYNDLATKNYFSLAHTSFDFP